MMSSLVVTLPVNNTCNNSFKARFFTFLFSCKNYHELAQARITKGVGFMTKNPTKLSLHFSNFSTIFYGFYKIQQKHFTI
jgi:hypothetical protein